MRVRTAVLVGLGLATAASMMNGAATAFFTDTAVVGVNSFTSGTLDIVLTPEGATATAVSFANMAPGDVVTAPLLVKNQGNLAFRYAMTSWATNADTKALKDALVFTVKTEDAGGGCAAFTGTQLYTGDIDNAGTGSGSPGLIFGNSIQGAQAGDRVLASGAQENLCLRVALPLAAANTLQAAATTATFSFNAEQTVNNP
jgi:Camelysin metallo-endopeptidase